MYTHEIASTSSSSLAQSRMPDDNAASKIEIDRQASTHPQRWTQSLKNTLLGRLSCLQPKTGDPSAVSSQCSQASTEKNTYYIVSNRVTPPGQPAAGGLAVALKHALNTKDSATWMGWDGKTIDDDKTPSIKLETKKNLTYKTFPLTASEHQQYYYSFSNGTLWPIFHSLDGKLSFNDYGKLSEYKPQDYEMYQRVNERFAKTLAQDPSLSPDDIIWAHDYHLITFAKACHGLGVNNTIGFFLHIPFPTPEVLRTIAPHAELVEALCHYDVIGFQKPAHLQAFTDYIEQGGGIVVDKDNGIVKAYGRTFKVGVYPIGIYPDKITKAARDNAKRRPVTQLLKRVQGRKVVGSIGRLDYTKGDVERLPVIVNKLKENPKLPKKVVFTQIAPSSRQGLDSYKQLKAHFDSEVEHINDEYTQPGGCCQTDLKPIEYSQATYDHEKLMSLLRKFHVAWITPLADGMNLLALEYVAAQNPKKPGVLIISKFAGAADHLPGAIVVDPFDPQQMAAALEQALSMPARERRARYRTMMAAVRENDLPTWYNNFTKSLQHHRASRSINIDYRPLMPAQPAVFDVKGKRKIDE